VSVATAGRGGVITALGIAQIFAWGSTYYLLAVLAGPIVADTGWPKTAVIAGMSLGLLVSGLVAIRVGLAIERLGGRPVLAASAAVNAAGLALMAAAPGLAVFLFAWVLVGLGMGAGLYDAAFSTLGRLFGAEGRRAITTLTLWGGFASTVCWPLSALMVEAVGWRGACLAYAALQLGLVLPLYLVFLPREARREPDRREAEVAAEAAAGSEASVRAGGRRRLVPQGDAVFWLLAIVLTTGSAIAGLVSVHLIALLQAGGLTLAAAVGLGALIGPAQVAGRVVEMLSGQRHHPVWTLIVAAALVALGLAALAAGFGLPGVALIAYGAGNGIWSIARGALPLALVGAAGYPVLMGRLAAPSLLAQAAAPSAGAAVMVAWGAPATLGLLAWVAVANLAAVVALRGLLRRRDGVGASPG
jgi:MFS family permease